MKIEDNYPLENCFDVGHQPTQVVEHRLAQLATLQSQVVECLNEPAPASQPPPVSPTNNPSPDRWLDPSMPQSMVATLAHRLEADVHLFEVHRAAARLVASSSPESVAGLSARGGQAVAIEATFASHPIVSARGPLSVESVSVSAIADEISSDHAFRTVIAFSFGVKSAKHVSAIIIPRSSSSDGVSPESLQALHDNCERLAASIATWAMCRIGVKWTATVQRLRQWCSMRTAWVAVGIFCLAMLIPIPYRPVRSCKLEPTFRHYLAAPTAGTLAEAFVRPGQRVVAGELLGRLDDRQLRRDLAIAQSEYESAEKKRDIALASRNGGELRIAQLEQQQAELKIASTNARLGETEIRSPADGIIVQGDWFGSEGMPLSMGQTLFEISDLNSIVARVELRPSDIADVAAGQQVKIKTDMLGWRRFSGPIQRIEPQAAVIESKCVFLADVELDNLDGVLRPGLKADAAIDVGYRTIGWQLFHQPYQWLANLWVW